MTGTNFGTERVNPDGNSETVFLSDSSDNIILASGATVPTAGVAGYAKGCIYYDTDASVGAVMFVNEGSESSANFNKFAIAATQSLTPDDAEGTGNTILAESTKVQVGAVTNDANDFVVLPALADVDDGHEITIICGAGTNFELRTPADSDEEINSENCDGTKEYLCTDTEIIKVIKIDDTIGWMAHAYSAIGAVVTAVVPD